MASTQEPITTTQEPITTQEPTTIEQPITTQPTTSDGNDNLANDKVDVSIKPDTTGNFVYISLCSIICSPSFC